MHPDLRKRVVCTLTLKSELILNENKIALITGASRGIGLAIAQKLAKSNFQVLLVARNLTHLEQARQTLVNPEHHHIFDIDLTQTPLLVQLTKDLQTAKLIPQVIVHNLGGKCDTDTPPLSRQTLRDSMTLNCEIALELNERLIPQIIHHWSEGRIVHISSDASISGKAAPGYAAAKAALNTYIKSAARFYAPDNIMLCAVLPGVIEFPGSYWANVQQQNPQKYQHQIAGMPLKRFGTPQEVAAFVNNLCTTHNMLTTGACFTLNGGA